jgi:hypothetical protein
VLSRKAARVRRPAPARSVPARVSERRRPPTTATKAVAITTTPKNLADAASPASAPVARIAAGRPPTSALAAAEKAATTKNACGTSPIS